MRNSRFRDSESAFGPGFPLGLRRLAGTPWPAPPATPEPEGVEGERSADPSSGRPRRRIISAFAAMRAARRRSYGVSPCMRARARSRRGGQRVSRPHKSRRARVETGRKRKSSRRGNGKERSASCGARGGGARTHIVGLAGVRHRGARACARLLARGLDVRVRARLWRGGTARGISYLLKKNQAQSSRAPAVFEARRGPSAGWRRPRTSARPGARGCPASGDRTARRHEGRRA